MPPTAPRTRRRSGPGRSPGRDCRPSPEKGRIARRDRAPAGGRHPRPRWGRRGASAAWALVAWDAMVGRGGVNDVSGGAGHVAVDTAVVGGARVASGGEQRAAAIGVAVEAPVAIVVAACSGTGVRCGRGMRCSRTCPPRRGSTGSRASVRRGRPPRSRRGRRRDEDRPGRIQRQPGAEIGRTAPRPLDVIGPWRWHCLQTASRRAGSRCRGLTIVRSPGSSAGPGLRTCRPPDRGSARSRWPGRERPAGGSR